MLSPLSRRLEDEFWFLAYRRLVADPRHQALKTAIGWNYDLLAAADAPVCRELSVQALYLFTHVGGKKNRAAGLLAAEGIGGRTSPDVITIRTVDLYQTPVGPGER